MRRLSRLAAISAALIFASTGAALAAPPEQLFCAAGVSGSKTFSVTAGDTASLEISNEAGSTIALSASLSNPAGTGFAGFSGGAKLMTFPGQTTATITAAYSALTFLWLESPDSNVTVTATCNPASAADQSVSEQGQNPASSTSVVRSEARDHFNGIVEKFLFDETYYIRSGDWGSYITAHIDFAVSFLGKDRSLVEAMFAVDNENVYLYHLKQAVRIASGIQWNNNLADSPLAYGSFLKHTEAMEELEQEFLKSDLGGSVSSVRVAGVNAYAGSQASSSSAVSAINHVAGASDIVQGSFNLLGYGPTGGFSGSAVLGRGDNWLVEASAFGAISQSNAASGGTVSISGRGTINLVGSLAPNLAAGLSLGIGATSEDGPVVDDAASHYAVDAMLAYRLAPNLSMSGNLGYELTSHNYSNSTGKGSVLSHLYSAGWGIEGKVEMNEFTLTPKLGVDVVRENAAAVTLSDGTTLAGFDRTTGKVTVGGVLSRDFLWDAQNSTIVVTPSLGADTSLSFTEKKTTAGVSSSSTLLGLGLTAGLAFALESGLDLSLSGRLTHAGNTTGAGLTGSLSAGF
jgi:hypothetical protein